VVYGAFGPARGRYRKRAWQGHGVAVARPWQGKKERKKKKKKEKRKNKEKKKREQGAANAPKTTKMGLQYHDLHDGSAYCGEKRMERTFFEENKFRGKAMARPWQGQDLATDPSKVFKKKPKKTKNKKNGASFYTLSETQNTHNFLPETPPAANNINMNTTQSDQDGIQCPLNVPAARGGQLCEDRDGSGSGRAAIGGVDSNGSGDSARAIAPATTTPEDTHACVRLYVESGRVPRDADAAQRMAAIWKDVAMVRAGVPAEFLTYEFACAAAVPNSHAELERCIGNQAEPYAVRLALIAHYVLVESKAIAVDFALLRKAHSAAAAAQDTSDGADAEPKLRILAEAEISNIGSELRKMETALRTELGNKDDAELGPFVTKIRKIVTELKIAKAQILDSADSGSMAGHGIKSEDEDEDDNASEDQDQDNASEDDNASAFEDAMSEDEDVASEAKPNAKMPNRTSTRVTKRLAAALESADDDSSDSEQPEPQPRSRKRTKQVVDPFAVCDALITGAGPYEKFERLEEQDTIEGSIHDASEGKISVAQLSKFSKTISGTTAVVNFAEYKLIKNFRENGSAYFLTNLKGDRIKGNMPDKTFWRKWHRANPSPDYSQLPTFNFADDHVYKLCEYGEAVEQAAMDADISNADALRHLMRIQGTRTWGLIQKHAAYLIERLVATGNDDNDDDE
jgi:hypothetical protein